MAKYNLICISNDEKFFTLIQKNVAATSFLENSADNQALIFRFFYAIFRHIFNYYKIFNLLMFCEK